MRLKQLASQTDAHAFKLLYHDARVHTSEIADRFGILPNRVSEFAHLLGVPTRREAGVMWKPTLLRASKPKREKLGPCNPDCTMWRRCNAGRKWLDVLPCETVLPFEVGMQYERDSLPSLWVIPIQVRVNVEAMG